MLNKIKSALKLLSIYSKPKEVLNIYQEFQSKKDLNSNLQKRFNDDFNNFNVLATEKQKAKNEFLYPCLYDNTSTTQIEPTYFYQDAWAFERIIKNKPLKHIDIGSQHNFVAHLSKVVDLTMVDIRPLALPMDTIKFIEGSILELPFVDDSIDSISSLCVIEHIGLGRYGDPIDPMGSEKALAEIKRVLKKGGNFYVSVPVSDKYLTRFNAGVIFEYKQLREYFEKYYFISDEKFIAESKLGSKFIPNDHFGTTALFELIKK